MKSSNKQMLPIVKKVVVRSQKPTMRKKTPPPQIPQEQLERLKYLGDVAHTLEIMMKRPKTV